MMTSPTSTNEIKLVWALKVHDTLDRTVPKSRVTTSERDPRDALISFKRFMCRDFERPLGGMRDATRACDYYRDFRDDLCLPLRCSDIVETPYYVVRRIAEGGFVVPSEIRLFGQQNQRAFDLTTGFHNGHVSAYQGGSWENHLTLAEKNRMLAVPGSWLRNHGYLGSVVEVSE